MSPEDARPSTSAPPTSLSMESPPERSRGRSRHAIGRGLRIHLFVFAVVAVDLLVLNLITNRDTIWAVWPIGVWAVLVAAHLGANLVKPAFFGVHLLGGGAICLGLGIINIFHGRDDASAAGFWVIWPILAWLVSLVIHLPFAFDLLASTRPSRRAPATVASTPER
ncbi:MAG TPA: 2TM domain-containing protein [Thermomicrobiales bacterium]|nr:2TM domain-containing protein [Thermomicrobiales bacterium]